MAAFMDELVIDPISGEQITARHSILVSEIPGVTDILEYLIPVASTIGPSNIRSAYRVGNNIKIYLRFLKHVEEVIYTGVCLHNQYTEVNYGLPPATEVVLKNVDSEIPNIALCKKLETYGRIVSKITTKRINVKSSEFSHVESNVRRVFMDINPMSSVPSTFKVSHGANEYSIEVSLVKDPSRAPRAVSPSSSFVDDVSVAKTCEMAGNSSGDNDSNPDDPPVIEHSSKEVNTAIRARSYRGRRPRGRRGFSRSSMPVGIAKIKHTMRRRHSNSTTSVGLSLPVSCRSNGTSASEIGKLPGEVESDNELDMVTSEEQEANVIGSEEVTDDVSFDECTSSRPPPPSLINMQKSDLGFVIQDVTSSNEKSQTELEDVDEHVINITQFPFSISKLELYLKEVKNHRNPKEVAVSWLKSNDTPGAVTELCSQLMDYYYNYCKENAVRLRIQRLVTLLSDGQQTLA